MAKSVTKSEAVDTNESRADLQEMAKLLFVNAYRPRSGVDAWMIAADCYRAAESFCEVSRQIAGGMTVDDVIEAKVHEVMVPAESQNTGGSL